MNLDQAIAQWWQDEMAYAPLYASYCGVREFDHQLPDVSAEARAAQKRKRLQHQRAIEHASLALPEVGNEVATPLDETSRAVALYQLAIELKLHEFPEHYLCLGPSHGLHVQLTRLAHLADVSHAQGREHYCQRLLAVPHWLAQHRHNLTEAVQENVLAFTPSLAAVPMAIDHMCSVDGAAQTFVPKSLACASEYAQKIQTILRDVVVPALRAFNQFLREQYLTHSRAEPGLAYLANGDAWYQALIMQHTSLGMSASEVHELGLREVEKTLVQANALLRELPITDEEVNAETITPRDTSDVFVSGIAKLKAQPSQVAKSDEHLLHYAAYLCKKIDGGLPALFSRLPQLPFAVKATPSSLASGYPSGFYLEPPADRSSAGEYWVNTYALASRPLFLLPALTLHEAMPGHHLQIALTQERESLPLFRRSLLNTAYEEGWALYAESLGNELGLYERVEDKLGWLCYRLWRAARLVIDTGLHVKQWSRDQAIDYLQTHSALSPHECATEVDRYIAWPGQALGYLIGEICIHRLRSACEQKALKDGKTFDLKRFHEEVLRHGELPLRVLQAHIAQAFALDELEFALH